MSLNREEVELLDKYIKGLLSADEKAALENRIQSDEAFRKLANEQFELINVLKKHGQRNELRDVLDSAHGEIDTTVIESTPVIPIRQSTGRNYWALSAMAASIAFISIAGTYFITRSLKNEQTAIYRELRRNVEQIKKSQKIIMDDIDGEKAEKAKKSPGKFAGTGFLISAAGYLTTSYHVVKESDSVYIENGKFGSQKATIVYTDPVNDVAILKMIDADELKLAPPYTIAKKETNLAEEVYTLGYPREDVVFNAGSISAMTGFNGNPNAYQVSVPVNPGNSGGPLFNSKGDLIGMISGKQTETSGVAFATKSTILLEMIAAQAPDSLRSEITPSRKSSLPTASRVEQVKQWRDYVFMVRVYKN